MSVRNELRKAIRLKRNQLPSRFQSSASEQLLKQLVDLPEFSQARRLALYLANDGELDLTPVIHYCWQHNKSVYLPVIHPFNSNYLIFVQYHNTSQMKANKFGIEEPIAQPSQICPTAELDLLLTPLVAFDHQGNRLGMGGGFYDRTLAPLFKEPQKKVPKVIGLAHDCQQVATIPVESWDIPIPKIITPTKQIMCR